MILSYLRLLYSFDVCVLGGGGARGPLGPEQLAESSFILHTAHGANQ